jgi:hypothetical protein
MFESQTTPDGPIVSLLLAVTPMFLLKQSVFSFQDSMSWHPVNFLIDSGSGRTHIDASIVAQLSMTPIGSTTLHGFTGPFVTQEYDAAVMMPIPSTDWFLRIGPLRVGVLQLQSPKFDGVLGRDALDFVNFQYSGTLKRFTLWL